MDLMEQPRVEARPARRPSAAASARRATSSGTTHRSLSDLPTAIHSSGPKSESPAVQKVASVGEALQTPLSRMTIADTDAKPVPMSGKDGGPSNNGGNYTHTTDSHSNSPSRARQTNFCLTAAVRVRSQRQEPACVLDTAELPAPWVIARTASGLPFRYLISPFRHMTDCIGRAR
jgi:hypothetical protein